MPEPPRPSGFRGTDPPLEEMGFELFVLLGISASPSWWSRARSPPGVPKRYRRILPVPGCAREGLLTEPTADALLGILDCAVHIAFNPVIMFKITQAGRTSSLSHCNGSGCLDSFRGGIS